MKERQAMDVALANQGLSGTNLLGRWMRDWCFLIQMIGAVVLMVAII